MKPPSEKKTNPDVAPSPESAVLMDCCEKVRKFRSFTKAEDDKFKAIIREALDARVQELTGLLREARGLLRCEFCAKGYEDAWPTFKVLPANERGWHLFVRQDEPGGRSGRWCSFKADERDLIRRIDAALPQETPDPVAPNAGGE